MVNYEDELSQGDGTYTYGRKTKEFQPNLETRKKKKNDTILDMAGPNWEVKGMNHAKFPYSRRHPKIFSRQKPGEPTCDNSQLLPFLTCPICLDPFVQATHLTCGHVFCYECIQTWSLQKSWCPLCQSRISSYSRVYAMDSLVQTYWKTLSTSTKDLILKASDRRLEILLKEKNSVCYRMYQKYHRLWLYFQSKGFLRGILRPFIGVWIRLTTWKLPDIPNALIGIGLFCAGCLVCNSCNWGRILIAEIYNFICYMVGCLMEYRSVSAACAN